MAIHPLAGQPAPGSVLIDVSAARKGFSYRAPGLILATRASGCLLAPAGIAERRRWITH